MIPQEFIDELLKRTDLAEVIGRDVKLRKLGATFTGRCPFHDDRSPSFSVIVPKRFYYCHACHATGNAITFLTDHIGMSFRDAVRDLAQTVGMADPEDVAARGEANHVRERLQTRFDASKPPASLAADYRRFWDGLSPLQGESLSYVEARGCAIPPDDGDLRFAFSLRHPSGYRGPALVALVTDAVTRQPMTLHRTWIKADGTKADVDPPRMLLGKHKKQGGVIRLWPDDAVTTGLAIAEGIETALTAALVFQPVWSLIDAGNMAAFPVLPGIGSLLIIADHDDAGLRAADQCAARWHAAGVEVRIAKSPNKGQDLNDYARAA